MAKLVQYSDFMEFSIKIINTLGFDVTDRDHVNKNSSRIAKILKGFFVTSLITALPMAMITIVQNTNNFQTITKLSAVIMISVILLIRIIVI